jgi:prepilin-type N-terminal cleavage/methylation domain-containing protein
MSSSSHRKGFTLIELLVVIAIIAILAVVVILTLNPFVLLQQSRDSNRLSDISTLNDAINVYNTDQGGAAGYSLGATSTTYVSVADPSATSTPTNCGTVGLPATTTGWTYHCSPSGVLRLTNGNGWIPIDFASTTSGSPLGALPVDPINSTSSLYYYTYMTNGSAYELTVPLESQKLLKQDLLVSNPDPTRYAEGNNAALLSQAEGFLGYWNFDEGGGSIAMDVSGNGNNGTWSGTQAGTSGYYSAGKVGSWAGFFNGSNDYVITTNNINVGSSFSIVVWVNPNSGMAGGDRIAETNYGTGFYLGTTGTGYQLIVDDPASGTCSGGTLTPNAWQQVVGVYNGSVGSLYVNGSLAIGNCTGFSSPTSSLPLYIGSKHGGGANFWEGSIDDLRIYNRALSATEIQEIYNAEN